jgi:predicted DNA-binding transcriptional regulator YafY
LSVVNGYRHGYYYTDDGVALPATRLSEGELVSLLVGTKVLAQYEGTPFETDLKRAFNRIVESLPEEVSVHLGELASVMSFNVTCPRPADLALFVRLTDAVRRNQRLHITYAGLRGKATERVIDPYKMASVDGAWYLAAFCHLRSEVRLFVPDRILDAEDTGQVFAAPKDFDFNEYMRGAFGVMRGGRRRRVRLRFTGMAARYVPERRWHSSQRLKTSTDSCELEMTVAGLDAVARWVMSFGGECKVLAPEKLRTKVVDGHRAGLGRNGGESTPQNSRKG